MEVGSTNEIGFPLCKNEAKEVVDDQSQRVRYDRGKAPIIEIESDREERKSKQNDEELATLLTLKGQDSLVCRTLVG